MQVILKEDVHNLGKAGELVTVKPGFGRNYLIPQGKAMPATAGNVKEIEHQKKLIAAKNAAAAKDAQSIADRLASLSVQIERQAGEESKLFGSGAGRQGRHRRPPQDPPGGADQDDRRAHGRDQARQRRDRQDQGRRRRQVAPPRSLRFTPSLLVIQPSPIRRSPPA